MEKAFAASHQDAYITRGASQREEAHARGDYFARGLRPGFQIGAGGAIRMCTIWEDVIHNVVTNLGKNLALDTFLAGSGYTVVGPFMGLISSVSYGGVPQVGDTMSSHSNWFEVSATTYFPTVAARLTTNGDWNAAASGSKSLTSPISFGIITNGGTLKGCFLVYGTGAVATLGSTAGTLYSAGLFSGGDKVVGVGDTVQVSYTAAL